MEQKPAKRIEYIDAMRGFTMILVVYIHVIMFGYHTGTNPIGFNDLFVKFRMPLFFFISGWVLFKKEFIWNTTNTCDFLKKKFNVQIIPTIIFLTLYSICFDYYKGFFNTDKGGYWFTYTLFFYFIFYSFANYLIIRHLKNDVAKDIILVVIGLFIYICSYFYSFCPKETIFFDIAIYLSVAKWKYFIFYCFGVLVKKHFDNFKQLTDNKYIIGAIISLFFLLAISSIKFHLDNWESLLFIIIGLLGITVIFSFFRRYEDCFTKDKFLGRNLQYIGRRTLDIYLLHYFFLPRNLQMVGKFFIEYCNSVVVLAVTVIFSLLVIAVSLVISNTLRISPFLGKTLFGAKS